MCANCLLILVWIAYSLKVDTHEGAWPCNTLPKHAFGEKLPRLHQRFHAKTTVALTTILFENNCCAKKVLLSGFAPLNQGSRMWGSKLQENICCRSVLRKQAPSCLLVLIKGSLRRSMINYKHCSWFLHWWRCDTLDNGFFLPFSPLIYIFYNTACEYMASECNHDCCQSKFDKVILRNIVPIFSECCSFPLRDLWVFVRSWNNETQKYKFIITLRENEFQKVIRKVNTIGK